MKCGKEIEDENAYCPYCGAPTKEDPLQKGRKKEESKERALASMILGIMSLFIPLFNLPCSIIAIVLSKKGANNSYSEVGKVTGIIGLIISIISYLFFIYFIILVCGSGITFDPHPYPYSSIIIEGSSITII